MALTIKWTKRARESFDTIVDYLEENWTEREIKNFIAESNKVVGHITVTPFMFRPSGKGIHEAVIVPQCILIYRVQKKQIQLLVFFNTKQHPKKKGRS